MITSPIILDSTGKRIATALEEISNAQSIMTLIQGGGMPKDKVH